MFTHVIYDCSMEGQTTQAPPEYAQFNKLQEQLNASFKQKEPGKENLPFLGVVKELRGKVGTVILDPKNPEADPFGIVIPMENFDPEGLSHDGELLIILSQGLAILGHKPQDVYYPLPPKGKLSEQVRQKINEPQYIYNILPSGSFVPDLLASTQSVNGQEAISTQAFLDLVFPKEKPEPRKIFRRESAPKKLPLPPIDSSGDSRDILLSLVNNKSLTVSSLRSDDPRVKAEIETVENITDYPIDQSEERITSFLAERIQFKNNEKPFPQPDSLAVPPND
jgi:hypothetical protein